MRVLLLVVLALPACTDSLGILVSGDAGTEETLPGDADRDTISDDDEGRDEDVDTDGDGVPDWQDLDSDNDGIFDFVEAGDDDDRTPPEDCDGDGFPNFRDRDSDNNGVLDMHEGSLDRDGDRILDFCDPDNDGDALEDIDEIGGNPASPVDFDRNGLADYNDVDSDSDTISDRQERPLRSDVDEDGLPDRHDLDTDGDGIPDRTEAGDEDLDTWPRDTDEDGVPDFRDLDSDNDGLSDEYEDDIYDCDPYNPDSDGDGVPDLIEIGAGCGGCTGCSPWPDEGNYFFIMPYEEDPDPSMETLVFMTDHQKADVFFLVDATRSMEGEISSLQSSLSTVVVPDTFAIIPDVWFGAGTFQDYPVLPYGDGTDAVFRLDQVMSGSHHDVETAVDGMSAAGGGDAPGSQVPALWAVATGGDLGSFLEPQDSCGEGEHGYPCFREDALPVIVVMTDALFHDGPGHSYVYESIVPEPPSYDETISALAGIGARVLCINSGGDPSMNDCRQVALDTGAVDVTGSPLYFEVSPSGTGLSVEIVDTIEMLAHEVPVDITARVVDDRSDSVDASVFIEAILPNVVGGVVDPVDPTVVCSGGHGVSDSDGDTTVDGFADILPGIAVCFDVYPRTNTSVPGTDEPQVFRVYVDIVADGIEVVDRREIYFLVPAYVDEWMG